MNIDIDTIASELSDALAATGGNYMTEVVDLGAYGTSCSITKHGYDRELHITPIEDDLLDLALFDDTGATVATGTLFPQISTGITPENLAKLVSLCFQERNP